jgi:EmrB/QacA subfamily drug resistance transporter
MSDSSINHTNKWVTLFIAVMASFLIPFIGSSINVALPAIGNEFALTATFLDWTVTAYFLAAAIFLVPLGRFADIKGRKRIFIIGIIIDAVGSALAVFSPSGLLLVCFRVLQGIGGAMIFGTGVAIVSSIFPLEERGKALGINAAAVYIGLSIGPPLSGFLVANFGWRSIFVVDALLGIIIIIAVFWKLKGEWVGAPGEKFDLTGSVVYGVSLLVMIYGFSLLPFLSGIVLVILGIAGLAGFFYLENRIESPVLNINLFRANMVFSMSNLAALINYSATFAVGFLLSLYLQYIKGYTPGITGLILVSQPVFMAILSPIAGRLSDKIEPRVISSIGMALSAAGLILLIFLEQNPGLEYMIFSLVILGIGFGLFSSPNMNAIMSSVEKRYYGVASGMLATMRVIGQMLSLGIVLIMFNVYIGKVQITPEYYPLFLKSAQVAFIVFAVLCCGGIYASLARGKLH